MERPSSPRMPQGPPPQRPQDTNFGTPMTRTQWRAWQARLAETNERYRREVDPTFVPQPPTVPEPKATLCERLRGMG